MTASTTGASSTERLRALRDRHAAAVADEVLRTGQATEEQVETLDRLSRLLALEEARTPPPRARWPMIAAAAVTLVIASVLLFARVDATDIELDAAVSRVSFVLPARQALTGVLAVSRLGTAGLREAVVPRAIGSDAQALGGSDGDAALQVSPGSAGGRRGTVNVDALTFPATTPVYVSHAGAPRQFRLEAGGAIPDLHVSVFGPTDVSVSGVGRRTLEFDVPSDLLLRPGPAGLVLDLTFPEETRGSLVRQLLVSEVAFQDVDETRDAERTVVRRVSTILSGTIYLESLNGKERVLRGGELVQFEASEGELRFLRFEDDRMVLNFQGSVRGMTVGRERNQVSLMPTWLEWLQARHGLSLLWATSMYLFGVITALLKWFGRPI